MKNVMHKEKGKSLGDFFAYLIVFGLIIGLAVVANHYSAIKDRKQIAYLAEHKCQVVSFIGQGRQQQAVYQCDNGRWSQNDLREKANP